MELEETVALLIEKIEGRYYGKYRGYVEDNADPEKLGRLKVKVPGLLGDDVLVWATPCVPYGGNPDQGFLFIPEKKAGVWIEFEQGDIDFPIWVGTFWSNPDGKSEVPKVDGEAQDSPTRKIIQTKAGHTIQLEDAEGEEKIVITHKGKSFISIDKDGSVIIGNHKGSTVILNAKDENIVLVEQHGNSIRLTDKGVVVVNQDGSAVVELAAGMARVVSEKIVLQGTTVALGAGASEPTIMGQTFKILWDTFIFHTHATALGPSGPPLPPGLPLMPGVHLTSAVVVK